MRASVLFCCGLVCLSSFYCPDVSVKGIGNGGIAILVNPGVCSMSLLWGVGTQGTMTVFSCYYVYVRVVISGHAGKEKKKIVVELCHGNWWKAGV